MLNKVIASRLERKMSNGRTSPCLITCESDQEDIELVVKFSAGCFEKEKNLVIEAIAAMLGADLGLPVPEPFLVEVDDVFIGSVGNPELQQLIRASNRLAFGSKKLPDGFAVWPHMGRVPAALTQTAAEIFTFDAIIINSDRRPKTLIAFILAKQLVFLTTNSPSLISRFCSGRLLGWKVVLTTLARHRTTSSHRVILT